jgi:hypothetical protein
MPSIKVMSWNIQNFGSAKIDSELSSSDKGEKRISDEVLPENQKYIFQYIVDVIKQNDISIIGIMEISGQEGRYIVKKMKKYLLPDIWEGVSSTRQQRGNYEEYVYLWKTASVTGRTSVSTGISLNTNKDSINGPSPASLSGIIDDNSMYFIFNNKPSGVTDEDIYQALDSNNYIKNVNVASDQQSKYRVVGTAWDELENDDEDIELEVGKSGSKRKVQLDEDQNEAIKNVLIDTDILLFPTTTDRSPFFLNLNLQSGANLYPILMTLYHAPKPAEGKNATTLRKHNKVFEGINNLGECEPMINAEHLLLMGDFNVCENDRKVARSKGLAHQYTKTQSGNSFVFKKTGAYIPQDVFASITGKRVKAKMLIGDSVCTTITSNVSLSTNSTNVKANPYDKFFFKSDSKKIDTNGSANCCDLIMQISPSTLRLDPKFKKTAKIITKYYKYRRSANKIKVVTGRLLKSKESKKRQLSKRYVRKEKAGNNAAGVSSSASALFKRYNAKSLAAKSMADQLKLEEQLIEDLMETDDILKPANIVTPPSYQYAVEMYSEISDHLPIVVTLTY